MRALAVIRLLQYRNSTYLDGKSLSQSITQEFHISGGGENLTIGNVVIYANHQRLISSFETWTI